MGSSRSARVLPIAPSTYFRHKAAAARSDDGARRGRSATTVLRAIIQRIWDEHDQVYGAAEGLEADGPRRPPRGALPRASA